MSSNNLKRGALLFGLLFILLATVSMVSASENITSEPIGDADDPVELTSDENEFILTDDAVNDTSAVNDNSTTPTVTKEKTKITVKSVSGTQGKKVKLTATVKTSSNAPVKYVKVVFKVNGKKYTVKTNANGVATKIIKFPKAKAFKTVSKTRGKIMTKTTQYKTVYSCSVAFDGTDKYEPSSAKFKVTSKKKSTVKKYKVIKKKKTASIPVKKATNIKKIGNYAFIVAHEKSGATHYLAVGGTSKYSKYIKFSSNIYAKSHGKKVYAFKKWLKSKKKDDVHQYQYQSTKLVYVAVKYTQISYKKIK